MAIRYRAFTAFLFTRGTARFSRGVAVAWPGFLFSLNPRGVTFGARRPAEIILRDSNPG